MLKIIDRNNFSKSVENIIKKNEDLSLMDAILICSNEYSVEIESIPKLLNQSLMERLYKEASNKNFFKHKIEPIEYESDE